LKAPGFNSSAYKVKKRFQAFAFTFNLRHYKTGIEDLDQLVESLSKRNDPIHAMEVGLALFSLTLFCSQNTMTF
jgi:hypothetical protein